MNRPRKSARRSCGDLELDQGLCSTLLQFRGLLVRSLLVVSNDIAIYKAERGWLSRFQQVHAQVALTEQVLEKEQLCIILALSTLDDTCSQHLCKNRRHQ